MERRTTALDLDYGMIENYKDPTSAVQMYLDIFFVFLDRLEIKEITCDCH